jgi:hypothetical protein
MSESASVHALSCVQVCVSLRPVYVSCPLRTGYLSCSLTQIAWSAWHDDYGMTYAKAPRTLTHCLCAPYWLSSDRSRIPVPAEIPRSCASCTFHAQDVSRTTANSCGQQHDEHVVPCSCCLRRRLRELEPLHFAHRCTTVHVLTLTIVVPRN